MEYWASTVLETISSHPSTPPSSPAVPTTAAAVRSLGDDSLPVNQARTADIELGMAFPGTSHRVGTERLPRISMNQSSAWQAQNFPVSASCSVIAKQPAGQEVDITSVAQPARWRLYAALLAGVFQQCLSNGLIMTYGTILSYYTTHLLRQASSAKLNLIGAVPPFFLFAMALPFGRLLDLGYHRRLNISAAVLITVSLSSLAFASRNHEDGASGRYYAVLLCVIPLGLGQSIYFLSSSHMARTWLPKRPGLALGVVNSGASIGGSIFPLVFNALISRQSFQLAMLTLAAIATTLSVFIVYFAMPHPHHFNANAEEAPRPSFPSIGNSRRHPDLLGETRLPVYVLSVCAFFAGVLCIPFYLDLWTRLLPFTPRFSLLTIMNTFQLPGRAVSSVLTDYIRSRHLHTAVLLTAALIVPPIWLRVPLAPHQDHGVTIQVAAYTFAAVYGLLHGSIAALTANDIQEILKQSSGRARAQRQIIESSGAASSNYGQLSGVVYTVASPFMLSGPLVSGRLADTLGVRAVGVWAAGCFALGATLMSVSLFTSGSQKALGRDIAGVEDEPQPSTQPEPAFGTGGSDLRGQVQPAKGDSWSFGRWRVTHTEIALR